jgi:hypothetical protein
MGVAAAGAWLLAGCLSSPGAELGSHHAAVDLETFTDPDTNALASSLQESLEGALTDSATASDATAGDATGTTSGTGGMMDGMMGGMMLLPCPLPSELGADGCTLVAADGFSQTCYNVANGWREDRSGPVPNGERTVQYKIVRYQCIYSTATWVKNAQIGVTTPNANWISAVIGYYAIFWTLQDNAGQPTTRDPLYKGWGVLDYLNDRADGQCHNRHWSYARDANGNLLTTQWFYDTDQDFLRLKLDSVETSDDFSKLNETLHLSFEDIPNFRPQPDRIIMDSTYSYRWSLPNAGGTLSKDGMFEIQDIQFAGQVQKPDGFWTEAQPDPNDHTKSVVTTDPDPQHALGRIIQKARELRLSVQGFVGKPGAPFTWIETAAFCGPDAAEQQVLNLVTDSFYPPFPAGMI